MQALCASDGVDGVEVEEEKKMHATEMTLVLKEKKDMLKEYFEVDLEKVSDEWNEATAALRSEARTRTTCHTTTFSSSLRSSHILPTYITYNPPLVASLISEGGQSMAHGSAGLARWTLPGAECAPSLLDETGHGGGLHGRERLL